MRQARILLLAVLLTAGLAAARDETTSTAEPSETPAVKRALNRAFRGRVVRVKKKRVTIFYDFEDPAQLEDFEEARPPRLLDASRNRVRIRGGRLVLEGSTAIRHKMEGAGELRAVFSVRVGRQSNVGTVFTEPILSDFFVVLNLFDDRFYEDGGLLLAACGLHEDEGAEKDMALVNWRDIYRSTVRKKVVVGQDAEVEVAKNGWKEYFRVEETDGGGSSKGKCRRMDAYKFGLWVHNSRATFDDLTLSIELTDEYLELNDLKAEIAVDWEEVPETGPLAGIKGVPPRVRTGIEAYVDGGGEARKVFSALAKKTLPKKAREAAAAALCDRKDPKVVPVVLDGLYSPDRTTRKLSIKVVRAITGSSWGYGPSSSEKARSKAIQKLNQHLVENRKRYFG
jgi:hypothetical protein